MRLSLNNMKHRDAYLAGLVEHVINSRDGFPEGSLRISQNKGSSQYYHVDGSTDKNGRYLSVKNKELIRGLAQKDYNEKVLDMAEKERRILGKTIRLYESGTAEDIYESLAPARKELVTPFWLPDDEYVKQWLDDPYEGPGFSESDPVHYTDSGIRVRSKSEVLITQRYCERNVPFKYEKSLYLNGWGWVSPDYHLLNVRLRREYIHEHLGMMDDVYYANQNIGKVHAYEKNGYIPGKNLILTFETKQHPINLWEIDEIIDQYLL